jgi:hypothetical protein
MQNTFAANVAGGALPALPTTTQALADTAHSAQALRTISGEQAARDYLERLHAQRVEVDELAASVAMLRDAVSLAGFCRVIEKALGVRS